MIKLQIKARWDEKLSKHTEFTVYLRFTDGIEPILVTDNFDNALAKIRTVQSAIPQVTNYDVEFI